MKKKIWIHNLFLEVNVKMEREFVLEHLAKGWRLNYNETCKEVDYVTQ